MKKRILFLIAFFILITAFNTHAYKVSDRVRIGIKYGSTAVSSIEITAPAGFEIYSKGSMNKVIAGTFSSSVTVKPYVSNRLNSYMVAEQAGFESHEATMKYCRANGFTTYPYYNNGVFYAVRHSAYTYDEAVALYNLAKQINPNSFILDPAPNRVILKDNTKGECLLVFSQDNGEILALEGKDGYFLSFGGISYRGIMEFPRVNNLVNVINNIDMQSYLYSVVAAEIGASSPFEAQKAQAICARTYTEENLNKHSGDGFNLCGTTHCQVYSGTKNENEQVRNSVNQTNNMILTYNGKPISAVYFAHSGGRTANVEDVWGTPYPYLKSVVDEYCTDYTWEYKIDYNDLTKKMAEKGYNLGTVTNVKVTQVTGYGLVKQLTIYGTNGSKSFDNTSARNILGLKSQCFTISSGGISYTVKTDKGTSIANISSMLTSSGIKTISGSVPVKNGSGQIVTLSGQGASLIKGKGYGHHVGLSQHGAMEYAKQGWTYDRILKYYYTGVTIEGA